MNLLGKIFTFAILFASILVLVVAVAVYGTHKNWQTEYNALQTKFNEAQTANQNLEASYLSQISQLKAEQVAAQQDVAKLETERDAILSQNAGIQKEVDRLSQERRANKWKKFRPSDITIDPSTGNYVMISSLDHGLVVITPSGDIVRSEPLPGKHHQAEGVAITRDNILIISDEATSKPAAITLYRWNNHESGAATQ